LSVSSRFETAETAPPKGRTSTMTMTDFPSNLRKPLVDLLAAGGCVARDGNRVLVDGPQALADALTPSS
jgi:hypothetical protein